MEKELIWRFAFKVVNFHLKVLHLFKAVQTGHVIQLLELIGVTVLYVCLIKCQMQSQANESKKKKNCRRLSSVLWLYIVDSEQCLFIN